MRPPTNCLPCNRLHNVGQALFIRGWMTQERTPLYVSGYAYPYISNEVLKNTLPWLTAIYIFSYGFTMEGELVPPSKNEDWMIASARLMGVRPVLVLTPLGTDGHFNNNLVNVLVQNRSMQQKLLWALGSVMEEKGYGGLDIDFDDTYQVLLKHESGVMGTLAVDVVTPRAGREFEVWGEGFYLEWGGTPDSLRLYNGDTGELEPVPLYEHVEYTEGYSQFVVENAYYEELADYIDAVRGKKKPRHTFERDREILSLIDRIEE